MKLQTRLAWMFGLVVTLTSLTMGALSYAAISARLAAGVDDSLVEAAVPLAAQLRSGRPPRFERERHDDDGETGLLLPATIVTGSGREIPASTSSVSLPVDPIDRQIAAAAEPLTRFRDVEISGRPYRLITQGAGDSSGAAVVGRDETENQVVLRTLAALLAVIGLAVAALAALAGWLLARRSARRLVDLTDAAESVARTGRLSADVSVAGNDEIARLGGAFNKMLLRLSSAQEDQARLVADAGHELRTPLTSLRTNVSLLRRFDDLPEPARQHVIADLDGETRELTKLVNEVVSLAAAEPEDTAAEPVALAEVAARVAQRARRRTARTVELNCDDSVVLARAGRLERAMWNLVDNAAKFSPPGAPIALTVQAGSVTVADRGPGIDPADLPRVFDRFYRATSSRSHPGSGLGLAIVADVAASDGGGTFARNRPDGGAEVGFWLPVLPRS